MHASNNFLAVSTLASVFEHDRDPGPMPQANTIGLRTQIVAFSTSALVAVVIFGIAAWRWTQSSDTVLPDGPVYQNGRIAGSAVGVRADREGRIHFAEIIDADPLLQQLGKFEYGGATLSISTIQIVRHPESGSGVRFLRVVARAN